MMQNSSFTLPVPPALQRVDHAGRIVRELWMNQKFFSVDVIPPWFSMPIYHPGDEQ
jgi:hypothetical protein